MHQGRTRGSDAALQRARRCSALRPGARGPGGDCDPLVQAGHPLAVLFLGMARRQCGDLPGALAILEPLAQRQAGSAAAHYELGVTLGTGRPSASRRWLRSSAPSN